VKNPRPKVRANDPDANESGSQPAPFQINAFNAGSVSTPKESDYLIKGVLDARSTSIWFGPPGQGKTFLLLHLAYSIAMGRQVFGRPVRQADTLYLALEGRGGLDRRIYALFDKFGPAPRFWCAPQNFQLLKCERSGTQHNAEHTDALVKFIVEHDVKFVVIDTLNLTLGGADENDNGDMGMLIKAANTIAMVTGAHVAFVAHSPKSGVEGGPRGGGAQKGNVDLVVAISGDGLFTATSSPPAGKIKDGSSFTWHFRLLQRDLVQSVDGEMLTSCIVEEADAPQVRSKRALTPELEQAYLDLSTLFSGPECKSELRPDVGHPTRPCVTHRQVNDRWSKTGRIAIEGKTGGAIQKEAQRMRRKLRDLGKIGMDKSYVWLTEGMDKGGQ
jgi:hypothetical protein